MSVTTDLINGIATKLAAETTPTLVWNPSGVYTANQTGIFMKKLPLSKRAIAITVVVQGDDISMPLGQVMVQLRGRGLPNRPTDVDDLLDSAFDVLHGTTNLVMGGCTVVQMNRRVSVPMGFDDATGWERVDQYYLDVDYPPTINRPAGGSW